VEKFFRKKLSCPFCDVFLGGFFYYSWGEFTAHSQEHTQAVVRGKFPFLFSFRIFFFTSFSQKKNWWKYFYLFIDFFLPSSLSASNRHFSFYFTSFFFDVIHIFFTIETLPQKRSPLENDKTKNNEIN
jgi:hypothetical protein